MTTWGVTRWIGLLVLVLAGCTGGDDAAPSTTTSRPATTAPTTTTAPERPASTTTTAFDPASVEGQVEAAYLKSWDVYADAVYNLELDPDALANVYAGESLQNLAKELNDRIADGRAAEVRVDHDYTITLNGPEDAGIVDAYTNHQVLIDSITKQPVEDDPNEKVVYVFTLHRDAGVWRVTFIDHLESK